MGNLRVLVVDDHPLMRQAICNAVEHESDLQVAGQAANSQEAVEFARSLDPDVIVMDLYMPGYNGPGYNGLAAIEQIMADNPRARILVLTGAIDDNMVLSALQAGALAYLMKDVLPKEMIAAIREVGQGRPYLSPAVALRLASSVRASKAQAAPPTPEPLTVREQEVLRLLGDGLSNQAIAQALSISHPTVRTHIHNIIGKLGLESRGQAILYVTRYGVPGAPKNSHGVPSKPRF